MSVERFAIQQIFTQTYKDVANTTVYGVLDDLKTCGIQSEQTDVYATGGVGNPKLVGFSHSKSTTGTATAATFKNSILGLVTGTDIVVGSTTVPVNGEVIITSSDASATEYTAVGTENAEIVGLFEYNSDGTQGTELTQVASTPATGEFSYVSGTKVITLFAGDYEDGTELVVFYEANTGVETSKMVNDSGTFSKTVRIEMDTLVSDVCSGLEYAATLIVPKAKLQGSWGLDLASDGDPAMLNVSFEALKASCTDSSLWSLTIIDSLT